MPRLTVGRSHAMFDPHEVCGNRIALYARGRVSRRSGPVGRDSGRGARNPGGSIFFIDPTVQSVSFVLRYAVLGVELDTFRTFPAEFRSGTSGQFDFTAADAPGFTALTSLLVDSVDDAFAVGRFFRNPSGTNIGGVAFAPTRESDLVRPLGGNQISFIRLDVREVTITNNPSPSINEKDFRADWDVTWQIWGRRGDLVAVPEPSSLMLFLFGAGGVLLARWRMLRRC